MGKKRKETEKVAEFLPDSFPSLEDELDTRKMVKIQNKKKKSGGFQSMGLNHAVFKGIIRKGYKIPTPIQRKSIPEIMEGKDVVAMARTGSGKTAAFLIPMFEKLQQRSAQTGARSLILSPTRELALQTLKFAKELGRFTDLRAEVILGGDSMEEQFAALHENPDIIIATPGRLLHIIMEMDLKLKAVQYVVFDEADRLFELGFAEQLREIIQRLPDNRQTVLFSATLPKSLVEFAQAGLNDPVLIRLDVETKISQHLKTSFLCMRAADKLPVLMYLLREVVKPNELAVIFLATKHHVEFVKEILMQAGVSCTYIYSSLDQTARKINVAKFTNKKTNVMLVTDVAARGIDIPMLDYVINFNFPAKPKLFIHRVGRVARAGRSGTAYSMVAPDELAYLADLHLFLGRPLTFCQASHTNDDDGLFGRVPQSIIEDEADHLQHLKDKSIEIEGLEKVCNNAYGQYTKSRPAPSTASIKRMKEFDAVNIMLHPMFDVEDTDEATRYKLVDGIKNYRPNTTIFETNTTAKSMAFDVMKTKRRIHQNAVAKRRSQVKDKEPIESGDGGRGTKRKADNDGVDIAMETFSVVIDGNRGRKSAKLGKESDYYVSYTPADKQTEQGLSVGSLFSQQAQSAILDLTQDDSRTMYRNQKLVRWDRKKKKYINEAGKETQKKIKTESGMYISASYRTNRYKDWREKSKVGARTDASESDDDDDTLGGKRKNGKLGITSTLGNRYRGHHKLKQQKGKAQNELLTNEKILKTRKKKEKDQERSRPRKDRGKDGGGRGRDGGGGRGGRGGGSFGRRGGSSFGGRGSGRGRGGGRGGGGRGGKSRRR